MKLSRTTSLKTLIGTASKQSTKTTTRVSLNTGPEDCIAWLGSIDQLSSYTSRFEVEGITGAQLLTISEDKLVAIGINSEVDRKYMLLQIARVREHKHCEARQHLLIESAEASFEEKIVAQTTRRLESVEMVKSAAAVKRSCQAAGIMGRSLPFGD